ncbi:transcription factor of the MADS box, partial [Modicella reniformis]
MSNSKRNSAQAINSSVTTNTGNGEGNGAASTTILGNNNDDHMDKKFKLDNGDGGDDEDDEDEDEDVPKSKRAGRRKIKIEYIEDKSRRHITFSKRKSGIMKKAYELSTLTGTQVLLLVVSETGLVYTFTTPKLQPLVTKAEGKNLIQACLHAPDKESTP